MTAARPAASSAPSDFVGRVERIEISADTAAYLVTVIETFGSLLAHRSGQPLPARLVNIQRALAEAVSHDSRFNASRASPITAGQQLETRANASPNAIAPLDISHSNPSTVDTATTAQILGIEEDSVRDLCRRNRLTWTKPNGRYRIDASSIAAYRAGRQA